MYIILKNNNFVKLQKLQKSEKLSKIFTQMKTSFPKISEAVLPEDIIIIFAFLRGAETS